MSDLVPGGIFLDEKSFLVLGSLKIFNMDPWIKVFHEMAKQVPKLYKLGNFGPRVLNFGNLLLKVLVELQSGRKDPWDNIMEVGRFGPQFH